MIKTTSVKINDNEYVITAFDAIKGNMILFKLIKYLRGGVSLFDNIFKFDSIVDVELAELSIGTAIDKILANIEPEEINDFFIMMLQNVSLKNKQLTAETIKYHFSGNYFEMYKLVIEIIKANYINEGTLSFFEQTRQKMASAGQKNTKDTQDN